MAARRKAKPAGSKKITDDDVKAAVDVISSEYWQDVRECAADFVERASAGEFKDREHFEMNLDEYVQDSQRVIYTYWARLGLLATNSADAMEEELGEVPTGDSSGISKQMYFAYRQDILNNIGSDIDFDE